MDLPTERHLIDKLRSRLSQQNLLNNSPITTLKSPKYLPSIHKRSTTETNLKTEVISRDVSHRFDPLSKMKSTTEFQEAKLKEILGIKQREKSLPRDLKSLELYISKKEEKISKKKVFRELELMKVNISKQKEKLLNKLIDEGGLLYKNQSGVILPQLTNLYENLLNRIKDEKLDLPRTDLDLGTPSGRMEVEIIICWLESMLSTFVHQDNEISLKERVRRASMIYTVCFREVVRQVSSHCIERGILLQKIWNAQIDIYCSKEDDTVQKIDEIKHSFESVLKDAKEKHKNQCKILDKNLKESKELIAARDVEIVNLKSKIDEMKISNEKYRRNLIMSSARPAENKKEFNIFDEETQSNSIVEKNDLIKAKIPATLYGYFDLNGLFYKKNVVQMANGKKLENNSEEIIKFNELSNKSTGFEGFFEYLLDRELVSDFSSQFPEQIQLSVFSENTFTYKSPGKLRKNHKENKIKGNNTLLPNRPFDKTRSTSVVIHGLEPNKPIINKASKSARNSRNNSPISIRSTPEPEVLSSIKIAENNVETEDRLRNKKLLNDEISQQIMLSSRSSNRSGSKLNDIGEDFIGNTKISIGSSIDSNDDNADIKLFPSSSNTRSRLNSDLGLPKKKRPKKNDRKSMVVSPTNESLNIEINILSADTGANINSNPMKYTFVRTPPVSSSSSSDEPLEKQKNKKRKPRKQEKKQKNPKNSKKNSKFEDGKIEKSETKKAKKNEEIKPDQNELSKTMKLEEPKPEKTEPEKLKTSKPEELKIEEKPKKKKTKSSRISIDPKMLELKQKKNKKSVPRPEDFVSPSVKSKSQSISVVQSRNPSFVKESLEKRMSEIDNDPLFKSIIFSKLRSVKSSVDLQDIIKDLFPEDFSQNNLPEFKEISIQTDELDNLLTLTVPKTPVYESRTPNRSRRTSFTRFEGINFQINPNSLGLSALLRSEKARSLKKCTLPLEEFVLGVINRKIVITHPGEKFFSQVLPLIKIEENKLPRISLKTLLKMINFVYQEKMTMFKDNAGYFKFSASMVLYDALMKKYGLKNVAEEHFVNTIKATLFFKEKYLKIMQFSKFLGCEDDETSIEEWNFYLRVVDIVESYGKWVLNEDINDNFCSLSIANQVIHSLFDGKLPDDLVEEIFKKINNIKIEETQSLSKRPSAQKIVENVNIDAFIQICIDIYISAKDKIKEKFWPTLNKEDVLTEENFLEDFKNFKFNEPEPFLKLFEKYAIVQKLEEDKVQKAIKVRSCCALLFEYSLCDIKDLLKKFKI